MGRSLRQEVSPSMKAVLLAGGSGTRMREETEFRPKPMVEIGGRPVLWHLMESISQHGIDDFIILAGYKSSIIKEYFLHLDAYSNDFRIALDRPGEIDIIGTAKSSWKVTILDTGLGTETGARLHMAKNLLSSESFLCTYGDGLASVSIPELFRSHRRAGTIGTLTVTRPTNRFGVVTMNRDGRVQEFHEKPRMNDHINIGFFVFEPEIFELTGEDKSIETGLLKDLVRMGELNAFEHDGFWEPMDTYREYMHLNALWESGEKPWLVKSVRQ